MRFLTAVAGLVTAGYAGAQATLVPLPSSFEILRALDHDGSTVLGWMLRQPMGAHDEYDGLWLDGSGVVRTLPRPSTFASVEPADLSADGSVAGGTVYDFHTPRRVACRWDLSAPSSPTATLLPGAPSSGGEGEGLAVSGDGATIVGGTGLPREAVRWGPSGAYELLGRLPGTSVSNARDVSFDGRVVVGESGDRPFRWVEGVGMSDLGVPAGLSAAFATHVSDDGEVVLGFAFGATLSSRVIWRWTAATGTVLLPHQPGSSARLFAFGLDGSGERVIGLDEGATPSSLRPTAWEWDGRAVPVSELLGAHGLPAGTLTYFDAVEVSGDGDVLAGAAETSPGVFQPVLIQLGGGVAIEASTCSATTPNQTGQTGALRVDGTPYAAANDIVLRAEALPPGAFTLFLTSTTAGQPTVPVGSVGALCLGGSIGRYQRMGEVRAASLAGAASLRIDLADTPTPLGPVAIVPGTTWHYQAWHRDSAAGQATSNFTSAGNIAYR